MRNAAGNWLSAACDTGGDGHCDGHDYEADMVCTCACHSDNAPVFLTYEDATEWHAEPVPEDAA